MRHASALVYLLAFCAATAQKPLPRPVPLTTFDDPADGITLKYPSVWKRIAGPAGYCQSMAVGTQSYSRFPIPVTFAVDFSSKDNVYEKTTLEHLTFLFGTVKGITDKQCDGIAREFPQTVKPSMQPVGSLNWEYGRGGECGLNHQVDAQVYTRTFGDRCYVIEADFDSMTGPPKGHRDLTETERAALYRHLNAITESVQVRSVMLPKSWETTTFHDPATGVSFVYPAAMQPVKDVTAYFSPAISQMHGLTWRAKLAYSPVIPRTIEEASTDLGELTFLYATKPLKSAVACRALARGLDDTGDPPLPDMTVDGVRSSAGAVSGAGLSHFVSGRLFATYRRGVCYLFEEDAVGLNGYAGDVTDAQWKEINAHLEGIAATIRFAR